MTPVRLLHTCQRVMESYMYYGHTYGILLRSVMWKASATFNLSTQQTCTAWRCPPNAARHSGTRWYLPLEFTLAPLSISILMVSSCPPPAASDRGVLLLASSQSTSASWCLAIRDCRAGSDKSDLFESSSWAFEGIQGIEKVWVCCSFTDELALLS